MTDNTKADELNEQELDKISAGANQRTHDHLTDHNW
tara:strand:+ start:2351 stop:2458 length:108 start_codon:yes stop_codon:yes gene_type:complete